MRGGITGEYDPPKIALYDVAIVAMADRIGFDNTVRDKYQRRRWSGVVWGYRSKENTRRESDSRIKKNTITESVGRNPVRCMDNQIFPLLSSYFAFH